MSYNGKIQIVVSVDHAISKTRDRAQQILTLIETEFEELQYGDFTNF